MDKPNKTTIAVVATLAVALALTVAHPNLLLYSSKQLFIIDPKIISEKIAEIGGFSEALANLIAQFLHLRIIAAAIIAALVSAATYLILKIKNQIAPQKSNFDYLVILPALFILASLNRYAIPLKPFIELFVLLPIIALSLRSRSIVVVSLLTVVAYQLCDGVAILLPLVTLLRQDNLRWPYIPCIIFALLPIPASLMMVLPYNEVYAELVAGDTIFYIVLTLIPLALERFVPSIGSSKVMRIVLPALILSVVALASAYKFVTGCVKGERSVIEAEIALIKSDHQGLYEAALKFPAENPAKSYLFNLALLSLDQFADKALEVQQFGLVGMNLSRADESLSGNSYSHAIYARLGLYNQAYRLLFESSIVSGLNRTNLNMLVQYNEKWGRDIIAQKYQRLLDKTLFSDHFKSEMPYEKVDCVETDTRVCNLYNICVDLMALDLHQPLSKSQADFLLVGLLISNRLYEFAKYSHYVEKYYGYSDIPQIYDEAFMLLKVNMSRSEFAAHGLLEPSLKSGVDYEKFSRLMSRKNIDLQEMEQFKGTLYYYINFLSPYGTEIIKSISDLTSVMINRQLLIR